jgi:hypothetical protein
MKLYNCFETCKRSDGEVVCLKDSAPEWLRDAVREAHGGSLPNDWIYDECRAACGEIDEDRFSGRYPEDVVHEHADGQVDVYTSKLFAWAADMCNSGIYADAESEASDLVSADASTEDRIKAIQYCAIQRITYAMIEAWRENADEETDEAEAS